jgi:hypothetical protein
MARKSKLNIQEVMDAATRGDGTGFCVACGAETDGCEPDARNYPCENCGQDQVFGAEEILIGSI